MNRFFKDPTNQNNLLLSLTFNKPSEFLRFLYLCGLGVMVISLPIFNVGMSVANIWLGAAPIVYFVAQKFFLKDEDLGTRNPFKNKLALLLISVYLLHFISMLYSHDLAYGWNDLRIKIPLLTLPFVLAYLPRLTKEEFKILLGLFLAALTFSVLSCLLVYWGFTNLEFTDVRKITVIFITRISHIRLSLLVVLGLVILYYYQSNYKISRVLVLTLTLLFIYFLVILQSVTGWIILLGLSAFLVFYIIYNIKKSKVRNGLIVSSILIFGAVAMFSIRYVNNYFHVKDDLSSLASHTKNGEKYRHDFKNLMLQNNHYVWINIAPLELEAAWNERSDFIFTGKDKLNHPIEGTAIRYMASKGLKRDREGVYALSPQDIVHIENGITNVEWETKSSIEKRFDAILFEFDNARNGGNPSGNSVVQRLEYWKAALNIFKENKWIGVGSGDVQQAFQDFYKETDSVLSPKYRLRAHNQYLTIAVSFGIIGLIWFLFVLIKTILYKKNFKNLLFLCFFIISIFSFLAEDTLETQAGVTFFSFFFSFFLFQHPKEDFEDNTSSILR